MAIRAVIDTNVWISAILNPYGYPAKLRALFEKGQFHAVISAPLLEEIVDVLQRPRIREKYHIHPGDIAELIVLIEERCENVSVVGDISICRDPDDNVVIETAIKGSAQFLVTRDDDIKHDETVASFLLQHGIRITTIHNFLQQVTCT